MGLGEVSFLGLPAPSSQNPGAMLKVWDTFLQCGAKSSQQYQKPRGGAEHSDSSSHTVPHTAYIDYVSGCPIIPLVTEDSKLTYGNPTAGPCEEGVKCTIPPFSENRFFSSLPVILFISNCRL